MFVKSDGLGVFGGGMMGEEIAAAEVAVAQSQATPFQRAVDKSSRRIAGERPTHFAQCHRLSGEPFAQPAPRFFIVPVFRLGDRLAVEFEKRSG